MHVINNNCVSYYNFKHNEVKFDSIDSYALVYFKRKTRNKEIINSA